MNAGAKLAAYALVLAAMLGGGAVVGAAVGPIDVGDGGGHGSPASDTSPPSADHDGAGPGGH